ncbi:MAG: hypothetical protein V9F05_19675 [Chitinophagaceae bacterium]
MNNLKAVEIWENKKTGEKGQLFITNNGEITQVKNFVMIGPTFE